MAVREYKAYYEVFACKDGFKARVYKLPENNVVLETEAMPTRKDAKEIAELEIMKYPNKEVIH